MPSLVLFGQRTSAASDDLALSTTPFTILRLAQVLCSIPIYMFCADQIKEVREQDPHITCHEKGYFVIELLVFLTLVVVLQVILVGLDCCILRISFRGNPTEPELRSGVIPFLNIKLVLSTFLMVSTLLYAIVLWVISESYIDCSGEKRPFRKERWMGYFLFIVICQIIQILLHLQFIFKLVCNITLKTYINKNNISSDDKWYLGCRCLCNSFSALTCFVCGAANIQTTDYADVAGILSDFFDDEGTLDIVRSDIIVGLMMLIRIQKQENYQEHCERTKANLLQDASDLLLTEEPRVSLSGASQSQTDDQEIVVKTKPKFSSPHHSHDQMNLSNVHTTNIERLDENNPFDCFTIAEGAHFMRHALAIYTWMCYTWMYPWTACCRLSCDCVIQPIQTETQRIKNNIYGDSLFQWHTNALLQQSLYLDKTDILYAQFNVGVNQTPYSIAVDHFWNSVVLSIRGTQSFYDVITDLKIIPVNLHDVGIKFGFDGTDQYCHSGFLSSATWIYQDLEKHGVLNQLLLGDSPKYPNYQLRVTGHSLGAGVAAILSLMLRKTFPSLRCLSFSPPGCVLSPTLATSCNDFITSFVLNYDIIPRATLNGMETLRDQVLQLIARIKVHKTEVIKTYLKPSNIVEIAEQNERLLYPIACIPDTEFKRQLENFRQVQSERKTTSSQPDVLLFPPGKIVHLVQNSTDRSRLDSLYDFVTFGTKNTTSKYTARWAHQTDFLEILVSSTMISDHMPDVVCNSLEELAFSFGIQAPFVNPS